MVKKKVIIAAGIILLLLVLFALIKLLPIFWGVFIDKKIDVKKSEDGQVNVLIMGIGGANHEGPELTDTIILAHINQKDNSVQLVSIPRDLYVDSLRTKINAAYATGQEKGDKGMLLARSTVASITGVRPDYVVVIDFSGFVKLVDLLGGIDVPVENTLDDYAYPVEGKENELCGTTEESLATFSAQIATGSATEFDLFPCRFTHLHVEPGSQHMDGALALKFVRSRHAQGDSYTDYARVSSHTGLPTVLGWTVHEWLWRGTYDIPAPRIDEVKTIYEGSLQKAMPLFKKYKIEYVILGPLESEKYPLLNSVMFENIGETIFESTDKKTKIVKLNEQK